MICERYWREGILQVERGEHDPHRDTCLDCRRAHAMRAELVKALPHVGATRGDPSWQVKVGIRIANQEAARARRSYWIGGGLAAACALAALWVIVARGTGGEPDSSATVAVASAERPRVEIVSGARAMRSTSARVGDRVRIYRAERLVLRCPAWQRSASCTLDRAGLVAETELATAGEYQFVVIPSLTAEPVGTLDGDLAAVIAVGGNYRRTELSVR